LELEFELLEQSLAEAWLAEHPCMRAVDSVATKKI